MRCFFTFATKLHDLEPTYLLHMIWGIQVYQRKIILNFDYFNQSIEMTEDESIKAFLLFEIKFICLSNDKILFKIWASFIFKKLI